MEGRESGEETAATFPPDDQTACVCEYVCLVLPDRLTDEGQERRMTGADSINGGETIETRFRSFSQSDV